MAKSLDQVQLERQAADTQGKEFPSEDVELAVNFGVKLLKDGGGMKLIEQALNESQDPAQVIGQFLSQIIAKLAEQMRDEYKIDPGIFLAKDGFLDYILNYIEKELGYPEEFSDQIYDQVLQIIKAAAMGPEAPNDVMAGGQSMPPSQDPNGAVAPMNPPMTPQGGQPPMGGM